LYPCYPIDVDVVAIEVKVAVGIISVIWLLLPQQVQERERRRNRLVLIRAGNSPQHDLPLRNGLPPLRLRSRRVLLVHKKETRVKNADSNLKASGSPMSLALSLSFFFPFVSAFLSFGTDFVEDASTEANCNDGSDWKLLNLAAWRRGAWGSSNLPSSSPAFHLLVPRPTRPP
jgi:hypothetical protein